MVENLESVLSSDTKKIFESKTDDGTTTFRLSISLDDDLNLQNNNSTININNKDLVDGYEYVTERDHKKLTELVQYIFDDKLKGNLTPIVKKDVFNDIIGSIGTKKGIRNKKLRNILGGLLN